MGRYEVIKAESYDVRYLNCPVQAEKYQILKDSETGKDVIRFVFVNYSDKVLTGLTFDVVCYGENNTLLGKISDKEILAECEPLGRFGKETVINTPYDNLLKVILLIKKASYDNATDWVVDMGTLKAFNKKLVPVSDFQDDLKEELNEEISKSGIKRPDYVFSEFKEGWICTCGSPNTVSDEKCRGCGADKFMLRKMFSTAYLTRKKEQKQVKEEVKQPTAEPIKDVQEKKEIKEEKPVSLPEQKEEPENRKEKKKSKTAPVIIAIVLVLGILLAIILPVTLLGRNKDGSSGDGLTDVYGFIKTYGSQKGNGDYEYVIGSKYYYDEMYDITLSCAQDNSGFMICGESSSSLIKILVDDKKKEVGYIGVKNGDLVFTANVPDYSNTSSDYSDYWDIVFMDFDESTIERTLYDFNKYGSPVYDFLLSEAEKALPVYASLENMGFSIKGSGSSAEYYSITTNTNIEGAGTYTTYSNTSKESGTSITLTASANSGYKFVGWYDGSTLLSSSSSYTFYMPSYDVTYTAKFQAVYKLSTTSNLESAGTFTKFSSAEKTEGESVTLKASANSGYKFAGWYNGNTLLSSSSSYSFKMPSKDVTYTAKFEQIHKVSTYSNFDNAGTFTQLNGVPKEKGESVALTASAASGYTFVGWYDGSTLLSSSSSYSFKMPEKDVNYCAAFKQNGTYLLSTSITMENAGTYTQYCLMEVNPGERIEIKANISSPHTFLGWYEGTSLVSSNSSYSFTMPSKDVNYVANVVDYVLETEEMIGTDSAIQTRLEIIQAGNRVSVETHNYAGYKFKGWYNGTSRLTEDLSYTFSMPKESIVYTAKFEICSHNNLNGCICKDCGAKVHNFSGGKCSVCGEQLIQRVNSYGNTSSTGEYVLFGSYPQSLVEDAAVKNQLSSKAGLLPTNSNAYAWTYDPYNGIWYQDILYGNNRYRGVYSSSTVYWFKYEPIKWRILSESGGEALILADMIIDEYSFNSTSAGRTIDGKIVYANDWEYSSIRAWLNNSFINYAFSSEQRALIKTQTLSTSKYNSEPEKTKDRVFLLTKEDVTNSAYGFSTSTDVYDTARQKKTTEYAKQMGVDTTTDSSYYGNGAWWHRSHSYSADKGHVHYDGYVHFSSDYTHFGVVPALKIKL